MDSLTFAFCQLRRNPLITIVGVLTLALGIGASTAIFSLVDRVFLSPLNFPDADRLVLLCTRRPDRAVINPTCSDPRLRHYRQEQTTFTELLASVGDAMALTGAGDPAQIFGERVTANYFEVLGVKPLRGRLFSTEEEKPGDTTVIVSENFWKQHLAADPNVIGRTITLNGAGYTIIGMVPTLPLAWTRTAELWTTWPFSLRGVPQAEIEGGISFLSVVARLKPGVSLREAQSNLEHMAANYAQAYPTVGDNKRFVIARNLIEQFTEDVRPAFLVLSCAAACILLIACVNVANLLLARFMDRQREIAVRTAIGATRGDILRLLLSESLMFGLIAGSAGLLIALVLLKLVSALDGPLLPIDARVELSTPVVAFALGLSLFVGLVVGVFPAWQGTRAEVVNGLKEGGRSATASRAARRFRASLLAVQVAIAVALLAGAGVLLSTFAKLQKQALGFRSEQLFMAAVDLPPSRYPDGASRHRFAEKLVAELQTSPSLEAASVSMAAPFTQNRTTRAFARADGAAKPLADRPTVYFRSCTPGYFNTLGIPLLAGRDFTDRDTPESSRVTVISQMVAEHFFPGEDPIGRRVLLGTERGTGVPAEIIGIVGSVRSISLRQQEEEIYVPWAQSNIAYVQVIARTRGRPEMAAADVRSATLRVDSQLPLMRQTTMENSIAESLGQSRLLTNVVGMFAVLAFVLAAVGIYSVIAYGVAQRTTEIGIRMTLGAQKREVLRLVIIQGMTPVIIGSVLGLLLTFAGKKLISSQLFGVSAFDPSILTMSVFAIFAASLAACWFPALRATKVDPLVALRTN